MVLPGGMVLNDRPVETCSNHYCWIFFGKLLLVSLHGAQGLVVSNSHPGYDTPKVEVHTCSLATGPFCYGDTPSEESGARQKTGAYRVGWLMVQQLFYGSPDCDHDRRN